MHISSMIYHSCEILRMYLMFGFETIIFLLEDYTIRSHHNFYHFVLDPNTNS